LSLKKDNCFSHIHCFLETHENNQKTPAVVNYHWVFWSFPCTSGNYDWVFWSFSCTFRKQWMWKQQVS